MSVFITLIINDIKLFFKDWKAVVLLLVMPFLFISLFVHVLSPYLNRSSFIEPFTIALVDNEGSAQTRIIARQLDEMEIFRKILRVGEDKAAELISQNKIAAAVVIPDGFSSSVLNGENMPVTVIGNKSMPLQSFVVKNLIESAANLVSAGQSAINTIYRYDKKLGLKGEYAEEMTDITLKALARNEIFSRSDELPDYGLTPTEYFTAALIVIFMMFAGMPGTKMMVSERSCGIARRLRASPAGTYRTVLSKLAVTVILSSVQFLVVVMLTAVIFKNYWGAPFKNILLLFCGIIFAVSCWSVLVSSLSNTPASADVIGNLGILLMAIVGGSIYPLSSMPGFVRKLSSLTINKWAMEGFMTIFSGNDALTVTGYVYALLLIGLALLLLSMVVSKLRGDAL